MTRRQYRRLYKLLQTLVEYNTPEIHGFNPSEQAQQDMLLIKEMRNEAYSKAVCKAVILDPPLFKYKKAAT